MQWCLGSCTASAEHGNRQTDQGKRNMLFLLYFPCTLKGRDFRYRAQKCFNSSSHSLPFVQAWKLLSWHKWLLNVQPAWTGYSRIELWPSACSFTAPFAFHRSPCCLKGFLQVTFIWVSLSWAALEIFPFYKVMLAGDTYTYYHPLPSSTMGKN